VPRGYRVPTPAFAGASLAGHDRWSFESVKTKSLLKRSGGTPALPLRSLGGLRRSGRVRLCLIGCRLALDPTYRQHRGLVEKQQRERKGHLAEHVGRREHRRDNEGDHDEIAAL